MKPHTPELSSTDVEIVKQEVIYQGHLTLLKYQLKYRLFAGGWSPVVTRELFQSRAAVGVLLFDPIRDEIVLIEEFRLGALEQKSPWILELVAGIIEPNESVVDVAKRECQEEAGCDVVDLIPMVEYWTSPGISTGRFSLFCGRVDASKAGGIFGLTHEHEDIRAHVFPKDFVYNALKTGEINNAATIIAVQWLQLHELEIKQQWK
ncbi:MAG TPA: NUDIX domain-containing protein [Gammaproteobacteria bacterium]|nr:NUDIX domain-containing protein [Gammaproteobacteria bacterium]